jgi:hypothetical protein
MRLLAGGLLASLFVLLPQILVAAIFQDGTKGGEPNGVAAAMELPKCEGFGLLDDSPDKQEMELVQGKVMKPLIKRVYASWLAHMPKEAAPPASVKGAVTVTFLLMADGSTQEIVITRAAANDALSYAARDAIVFSHHEISGRKRLYPPSEEPSEAFPSELHRSSLHIRVQFLYNLTCVK